MTTKTFSEQVRDLSPVIAKDGFGFVKLLPFGEMKVEYPRFFAISEAIAVALGEPTPDVNDPLLQDMPLTETMKESMVAIEDATDVDGVVAATEDTMFKMAELSRIFIEHTEGIDAANEYYAGYLEERESIFANVVRPAIVEAAKTFF